LQGAAADNADLAHLPADQGGVGGGAAEGRQDAVGRLHAADVLRAGFAADQDDAAFRVAVAVGVRFAVPGDMGLGVVGEELDEARGSTGTGVNPLGDHLGLPFRVRVKNRLQQLVQV